METFVDKLKINDLKGGTANEMLRFVNQNIANAVQKFVKKELNHIQKSSPKIITNAGLKKFFSKNGIRISDNTYRSYRQYIMSCDFSIQQEEAFKICPRMEFNKTKYEKQFSGSYEFIDYEAYFTMQYVDIGDYFYSRINFSMKGDLDKAVALHGPFVKKTQIFKDVNDVEIKKCDDIIWTVGKMLHRSFVDSFDENAIITIDKKRIHVSDKYKNYNVMVIKNEIHWAGIKI